MTIKICVFRRISAIKPFFLSTLSSFLGKLPKIIVGRIEEYGASKMDNKQQIKEIKKYRNHLCKTMHKDVDLNTAAVIWINKYAKLWRLKQATK